MTFAVGWEPPDLVEWIVSDRYLDRGSIYPRQLTLLKIVFLADEQFTEYDHEVIGEWTQNYIDTADETGEGNNGIVPDVYDRIRICKEQGRPWFRENVIVIGRRGSKGHMGAIAASRVLDRYMSLGDPQGHFGVDRDKQMAMQVFAGKKSQAVTNQWGDINNVIVGAPHFSRWIAKPLGESLAVWAPNDLMRIVDRWERGVQGNVTPTFIIEAKESTVMAARGPASFSQYYDEMAHVVRGVAKASAEEVYGSAVPALDQFKEYGFLWEPSSPWQKIGQFYENYQRSLEHEPDGTPTYPELFMAQLTSWDPYVDWEIASQLRMEPGGLRFRQPKVAIQVFDTNMERLERANPETFRVERRSHWASVINAYLKPDKVDAIWAPWPTEDDELTMQHRGILAQTYRAHGDPSKSGAGFGWAIGHLAGYDERELPHVVFDKLHAWLPEDYEGHEVDYEEIGEDIKADLDAFMPDVVSFDQFNSVATIQMLRKHARDRKYPKRVTINERTATGPLNWKTYETFKTAVGLGLVHAPYFQLAAAELEFLQEVGHHKVDHPTSGPVQTKDVADCMAIVVYELIGEHISAFIGKTLSEWPLGAAQPGGIPLTSHDTAEQHQALSRFTRGGSAGVRRQAARTRVPGRGMRPR